MKNALTEIFESLRDIASFVFLTLGVATVAIIFVVMT